MSRNGSICSDAMTDAGADFTTQRYRALLRCARHGYVFADYRDIPYGSRFVLWRHDCDFSLNRALALARIEHEEGVCSTFFVNPHCEFYNVFEASQVRLLEEIQVLGHDIGLHFDGDFHETRSETDLVRQLGQDARVLEGLLGCELFAFSFHNPRPFHLACDAEEYAGLRNCYSKRFREDVAYCSDSNGHWRFRPLDKVLREATDPRLQILTHPCWWQESPMPPRQRIYRSIYGRADAAMRFYDQAVRAAGRRNLSGLSEQLRLIEPIDPGRYGLWDHLCNRGEWETLFVELWRFRWGQIRRLCGTWLERAWGVPSDEIRHLLDGCARNGDALHMLRQALDQGQLEVLAGVDASNEHLADIWSGMSRGDAPPGKATLAEACTQLCRSIEILASWGADVLDDQGLAVANAETPGLGSAGSRVSRGSSVSKRWLIYKAAIEGRSGEAI